MLSFIGFEVFTLVILKRYLLGYNAMQSVERNRTRTSPGLKISQAINKHEADTK
jgi:hypothetical protein